jgi:hypothetical protein
MPIPIGCQEKLPTRQNIGILVGAAGMENNNMRNFKGLRGMQGNTKSLKRNDEARKGILIAPSKLPRFSYVLEILTLNRFLHCLQQMSASGPRFAARMASRQTLHRKLGKSAGNAVSTTYEAFSGALNSI